MSARFPSRTAAPIGLPLLLAAVVSVSACSKSEPAPEPVRSVKVLAVGMGTFNSDHEFAGEVKAQVESRLGFRVAGKIMARQAELGQHVKAGQLLAQLDARDYQLAADAARAQVAAAQTNRDLAAADFKRYSALRDQNFISGAELERREATLKAAQAQLDQAHAQLASQGNQAAYANLVADASGVITAIEAEPGQVVSAGMPVVRIARDGARDVVFSVPEDKVGAIQSGADVTVRYWSDNSQMQGKVREVAASADPVTRTFMVKVAVDPKASPALGATVSVTSKALSRAGAPVIKLPTSALRQEGQGTAVWVLDKSTMTVKSQPVQIAAADGNEAVIASGLQPGMLVVSAGVHVLSPGQKVVIYQERSALPVSAQARASDKSVVGAAATAQAATMPGAK
jgi:membrane fusion protein, multidrug efflux system